MEELLPFNEPGYVADPYAHWERLRNEAPVYWCESDRFWAVTRYDDVLEVLHDPARFSSQNGPAGDVDAPRLPLIQDDPPHHDRLRRILSKAFIPRSIAQREERIREIASELMDDIRKRASAGEEIDLVHSFSGPFPVNVIAEILGIPTELRDQLRLWRASSSVTGASEIGDSDPVAVMSQMYDTLAQLIESRRAERREDLFSALIEASESDENPLKPEELVGLCQLLWTAGNETTTNLLSNAALVLQDSSELLDMVRAESTSMPAIVEEMLRLHSPINCLGRTAMQDVEMHGEKIKEGDLLMVMFASANRDPRHFDRPDEFNPNRQPNDHVALSHGIHFCLGSHLARLEARVGLEALGQLLATLQAQPDAGARIPFGILRGWMRLPLAPRAGGN
jgi:cytochrome P450